VHSDRIEATEFERADSEPGAPTVLREAHPKNLAAAYAFIHDSCARKECLGVILFLDGQSKNAVIESALAAARSTHVPEPLLALRDSDAAEGEHDNDFRALKVAGRLPPELIQAVVRKHYGLFRGCYERGLGLNPALTGKITARFVIDRDGTVTNASNAGSDLPDAEMVKCVVSQFYKMKFPFPEDGIVTVVYPIIFSPG
jgi:hypothetical protein